MQLYKDWIPDWSNAYIGKSTTEKTIEVPMMFKTRSNSVSPEAMERYLQTNDPKYLQNMTRLVIRTGLDTDQWCDFIMKVVPAVRFLDNGGNLEEVTYMNTGDNFDGSVMYYKTSDWDIINGWVYEDGEITGSFSSKEPYAPLTRVHAAQSMCIYEIIYSWNEYTDHKGQIVQFGGTITYDLLYCYPMEDGGGDSGDGGSGGSNYGNPTGQSGQNPGNFKLTDEKSKEMIPMVTSYLLENCVGTNLVSNIESLNISFVFKEDHKYLASYTRDKKITWSSMSTFVLFEELFHAYQDKMGYIKRDGSGNITNMKNMEVEAKLALYQYTVKTGATKALPVDPQAWRDAFDPYIGSPTPANYQKMLDFLSNWQLFGTEYANKTELSTTRTTNNATTILKCPDKVTPKDSNQK